MELINNNKSIITQKTNTEDQNIGKTHPEERESKALTQKTREDREKPTPYQARKRNICNLNCTTCHPDAPVRSKAEKEQIMLLRSSNTRKIR